MIKCTASPRSQSSPAPFAASSLRDGATLLMVATHSSSHTYKYDACVCPLIWVSLLSYSLGWHDNLLDYEVADYRKRHFYLNGTTIWVNEFMALGHVPYDIQLLEVLRVTPVDRIMYSTVLTMLIFSSLHFISLLTSLHSFIYLVMPTHVQTTACPVRYERSLPHSRPLGPLVSRLLSGCHHSAAAQCDALSKILWPRAHLAARSVLSFCRKLVGLNTTAGDVL